MAECVLAVSFAPLGLGLNVDCVDQESMMSTGEARPVPCGSTNSVLYTDCGVLLPGFESRITDDQGRTRLRQSASLR